jgi:prevent-host-death family protein
MADVKVRDLRQNLPAYLARVQRGERLRVTSRGKPVAEIVPPAAPEEAARAARERLKGSILRWDDPLSPAIDPAQWDMNR